MLKLSRKHAPTHINSPNNLLKKFYLFFLRSRINFSLYFSKFKAPKKESYKGRYLSPQNLESQLISSTNNNNKVILEK